MFLKRDKASNTSSELRHLQPLFEGADYLTLLHLSPDATPTIRRIAAIVREQPDSKDTVTTFLSVPNWRLHLVAAIAALMSSRRADWSSALWSAFDGGSWVSPQLAVTLSYCDPEFVSAAKHRILAGSPVTSDQRPRGLLGHVLTGPANEVERSAKNVAALLGTLQTISSEAGWTATIVEEHEVKHVLESDRDYAGELAKEWNAALHARFKDLGLGGPLSAA